MKPRTPKTFPLIVIALVSILYLTNQICYAETEEPATKNKPDFTKFSLEELKNVEIVSVSKKPQKVSEVPAAVYVISQSDIRRSGATSIPEALRMAPGVNVARRSATEWAINIRGLNDKFANNLLVLIDGRSVYSHLFSGVFWDIQDTVMEDIERIEVIRGPGAAMWGANAVNGVINIITKQAQNTQGTEAVVLAGSKEQSASARYGGNFKESGSYRLYGKFFNRGKLSGVDDAIVNDYLNFSDKAPSSKEWRSGRAGFRMDLAPGKGLPESADNNYTIQGEAFRNRYDQEVYNTLSTSEAGGGHLLGRWQHTFSRDSDSVLQFYYNHDQKDYDPGSGRVNTADLDFQHHFVFKENNDIVWGLEYKYIGDEFQNSDSDSVKLDPENQNQHFVSTFIQDNCTITPDRLTLTLGSKFEHNQITGMEIQPTIRLRYTPNKIHSFWAAVSRAIRVPSRIELDGTVEAEDDVLLRGATSEENARVVKYGNPQLASEKLMAYEIGHSWQPNDRIWFNTTVFYHDYKDLIGLELEASSLSPPTILLGYENNKNGRSYGLEWASDWKAMDNLLLIFAYTFLHNDIEQTEWDPDQGAPRNMISIRSLWDVTSKLDFDLWLRYVDNIPEKEVSSYSTLDARLAYRIEKYGLELSLVGQNLFAEAHREFSQLEVDRSIYAKLDWQF